MYNKIYYLFKIKKLIDKTYDEQYFNFRQFIIRELYVFLFQYLYILFLVM